ncbi:MAG: GspE/PulE family protein [Spirochaetaceae bacterium]
MVEVSLEYYKEELKTVKQYPIQYIQNSNVIKLSEDDENIILGILETTEHHIIEQLQELHKNKQIKTFYINSSELTSFISKSGSNLGGDVTIHSTENDLNRLANDAPIINLVNSIIIDGINKGASDIHIECYKDEVALRYRIDGVLIESDKINRTLFTAISSRIKIMSNLNIMERRLPQDGRCSVTLEANPVDLRISIIPLSNGESIVLRLFVKKSKLLTLEDLGFTLGNIDILNKVSNLPHGLILITGPTGSGKTTTLNALLQRINSAEKKIITIEDPVEYSIPGVNQIQVNQDIDLSFSAILRRVLRQDPDVIMIGEIRDKETADLVIRAALTGHLVLSTLHTNDATSSLSRLKDMGIPDYLLTSVLKATFAQRLVRTLCPECKKLDSDGSFISVGCNRCFHTGFKGRIAISEGFVVDSKLENLILDGAKPYQISEYLTKNGMQSLYNSGLNSAKQGLTTIKEINRVLSC